MNAHNLGQQIDTMTLEQFELESVDERHDADFVGKLNSWWCQFWTSCAAKVALNARSNINETLRKGRKNLL